MVTGYSRGAVMRKSRHGLRLAVNNDADLMRYRSGRSRSRGIPETDSTSRIRSAGTLPDFFHFWMAWYLSPHLSAVARRPPQDFMTSSTTLMPHNLQPLVAVSQQPRDAVAFPRMQLMVASSEKERTAFKAALNAQIKKLSEEESGKETSRPSNWLFRRLEKLRIQNPRKNYPRVSSATCGYWVRGEKIATPENSSMLMAALGMKRGQLFGEASGDDDRLTRIIERWDQVPEHIKQSMFTMVSPEKADAVIQPTGEGNAKNTRNTGIRGAR